MKGPREGGVRPRTSRPAEVLPPVVDAALASLPNPATDRVDQLRRDLLGTVNGQVLVR